METELSGDKKKLFITPTAEEYDKAAVKRKIDANMEQRNHYVRQIEAIDLIIEELEAHYSQMK